MVTVEATSSSKSEGISSSETEQLEDDLEEMFLLNNDLLPFSLHDAFPEEIGNGKNLTKKTFI